jgi:ectoine hydroxylase-related dioxygenase (phytanoyl-CoA dioxygenase family)
MTSNKQILNLQKNGFILIKRGLTKGFCETLIKRLKKLKPKVFVPNSKTPYGYGNLIEDQQYKKITLNKKLVLFLDQYFKKKYSFNHLLLQDKAPWTGPQVEWHQEIFNINTFAPGTMKKDWKNFLNIYIALEKQDIENGCLKVFKGSHKLGILPHDDIINEHLNHKRQVKYDLLEKINKKFELFNCNMNQGDILIFNHKLIHGSGSNASSRSRKSIVMQARSKISPKRIDIFNKETKYRSNFAISKMKEKIISLSKNNIYKDFNKKKTN